ncbi:nose resistant to fluoxetine protein 6-like [Hetaerina americana]|uniref:nose resistant to fluoxetine protein 6-like n=1 Tax=Hetaerina americana TaxID=62018 RepID=UPI003A7F4417
MGLIPALGMLGVVSTPLTGSWDIADVYFLIGVQISLEESSNGTPPDMYETVLFQLEKESSSICRQHAHDVLISLRQSVPWAVKMYDSGGKFPRGIITSVSHHAGNYYDCTDVERTSKKAVTFQGQYCVVPLEIYEGESTNEAKPRSACDKCSSNEDQKQKFQNSSQLTIMGNHLWMDQQKIFWALCIPSTCCHIDLRIAMNKVLADLNTRKNLLISATIKDIDCSTQQKETRSMHGDIFFFIIACLCFICMASTIYDWYIQQNGTTSGCKRPGLLANTFLSFSLKKNYDELVHEPSKSDGMRVLYGLRVISAIFIMAFHRMLLTNFTYLINPDFMILVRVLIIGQQLSFISNLLGKLVHLEELEGAAAWSSVNT